jgi:tetratricopeptide (TPR) repeat protein
MRRAALFLTIVAFAGEPDVHDRAKQLLATGRAAEAARLYAEAAGNDPRNKDLLLNLAIACYKAGQFREAATAASSALNVDADLTPARLFLGASQLELGEYTQAIEALTRVVSVNPADRNGVLMLGEALVRAGRHREAIAHLTAASSMLPANPRVWYFLGQASTALGDHDRAADAWNRLMALPDSFESHVHSAEIHDNEHRWREAAGQWRSALKLAPENPRAVRGLAWSLFRSRDYEGAKSVLAAILPARSADVSFLYGASLLNQQQPAAAIPYLEAAILADPQLIPARAALGQALLQTGKPAGAIPLLRAALNTDEDGTVHFQLFRAYQLTNQTEEAKRSLAAYQRLRGSAAASAH